MKQIIIFLLIIILLIIGYGQYKQYKRFTLEDYEYQVNDSIDLNYHDKSFLLDYYEAIEELNGFIITQWSANEIDVRTPEDDDEETKAAVALYSKKLGKVKFFESQLIKSAGLKKEGFSNKDVEMLENSGLNLNTYNETRNDRERVEMYKAMFNNEVTRNNLRLGSKSAFIYEIQKILVKKGYEIPVDGVYKFATLEALKAFEEKNNLFPDGYLDAITLEHLLE